MNKLTIAIDGFSGVGKSTFARSIAARLGYIFIDSGAMYRAVTLWAIERGFFRAGELDEAALIASLPDVCIEFRVDEKSGSSSIFLNGRDVSAPIRGIEVSDLVSRVSSIGEVRRMLVRQQRAIGAGGGVVMDGRDIGSVVFPDADLKIFLTADPAVRAKRRFDELQACGQQVSLADVERNIRARDAADQAREISPLVQAPNAIVLDNSNLTPAQQMAWLDEQLARMR